MNAPILIRTIQPDDRQAVLDLHRKYYWRSHCLVLNADFYRWQFEAAPDSAAVGGDQSVVAMDDRGGLLSYFGAVPGRCSYRGRPLRGVHLITWLSPPEARGRGIGTQVLKHFTEHFDFVFTRGPRPDSLPIFRKLGFRYFDHCSRWLAVLDADAVIGLAIDATEVAIRRARARSVRPAPTGNFCVTRQAPPGASSLARAVLSASLSFDRSSAYLRWRYEEHPCHRYEFVWIGEPNAPTGVAVTRVEEVSGRPGRVLRVLEFLAAAAHAARLAEAVFAHGRERACAFADVFGMSEHFVAGFVAAGGFNTLEEPDLRLPHLFQPWAAEVEIPGFLFFGRRLVEEAGGVGCVDDMSLIHVSKGDGNLDWPSWHPAGNAAQYAPAVEPVAA